MNVRYWPKADIRVPDNATQSARVRYRRRAAIRRYAPVGILAQSGVGATMSGMQKLVVAVSLLIVISIFVGVVGAFQLRQRWPRLRWPFVLLLAVALVIIVASAAASSAYPGPAGQYWPDSFAWTIRERLVYPSGMLVLATPVLIALAAAYVVPGGARRAAALAATAGVLSIPVALLVLLFNGCNYAGACL